MAKKQKNYRFNEDTLEKLGFVVSKKNELRKEFHEKNQLFGFSEFSETDIIMLLILEEYDRLTEAER